MGLTGNLNSLSIVRLDGVVVHGVPEETENVEHELLLFEIGGHGLSKRRWGVEGRMEGQRAGGSDVSFRSGSETSHGRFEIDSL